MTNDPMTLVCERLGVPVGTKVARCPAHEDRRASLSVDRGREEQVLLHCHVGCPLEAIVEKLGLTIRDLFPRNGDERRQKRRAGIVATYDYYDEAGELLGELLFQVVRFEPKDFRQCRPVRPDDDVEALRRHKIKVDADWVWSLNCIEIDPQATCDTCKEKGHRLSSIRRVLYRLPELLAADPRCWILVVEGEKDVDRLAELDVVATTNPGGAGKWRSEYNESLRGRHVALLPDNDDPGRKHAHDVARSLLGVAGEVRIVELPGVPEKGDVSDWLDAGGTKDKLLALVEAAKPLIREDLEREADAAPRSPWAKAVSAPDFIARVGDEAAEWIAENLVAPGSVTVLAAPRGLGKTHVAHHLAVAVATGAPFRNKPTRQGKVLLLDRDNSKREVRRRIAAWGGENATDLRILTRDEVPPLTEAGAWASFPFAEYSLVILDSVSAATEGVDEKEGGGVGKALAPLLDLARRGPAVLVLANTRKDGEVIRGSGVIGDRADVVYEVRDATDLVLDPKKDAWWECLPESGETAWSSRSKRRRQRDDYRLACVPSKFRIGEEPTPWAVEIRLGDSWSLRDVTDETEAALEESKGEARSARAAKVEKAVDTLSAAIVTREAAQDPLTKTEAEELLAGAGLTRTHGRAVLKEHADSRWRLVPEERRGTRGGRRILVRAPVIPGSTARNTGSCTPDESMVPASSFPATHAAQERREIAPREPLNHTDSKEPYFSPPIPLRLAPEDWTGEMRDLTLWFLDRQLACDLPTEPFYLWPHARIAEPEKWYGSIDTDIEAGPKGPRAGSLLGELRRLREIVEETHRPA